MLTELNTTILKGVNLTLWFVMVYFEKVPREAPMKKRSTLFEHCSNGGGGYLGLLKSKTIWVILGQLGSSVANLDQLGCTVVTWVFLGDLESTLCTSVYIGLLQPTWVYLGLIRST